MQKILLLLLVVSFSFFSFLGVSANKSNDFNSTYLYKATSKNPKKPKKPVRPETAKNPVKPPRPETVKTPVVEPDPGNSSISVPIPESLPNATENDFALPTPTPTPQKSDTSRPDDSPSGMSNEPSCDCPGGLMPECYSGEKFICYMGVPLCVRESDSCPRTPSCFPGVVDNCHSGGAGTPPLPDSCYCSDMTTPECYRDENFLCTNGVPICRNERTSKSFTPDCFVTGMNVLPVDDGCCRNCPNGFSPSCPSGYGYWCIMGAPRCCMGGGDSLNCADSKEPSCFYPGAMSLLPPNNDLCDANTRACPDGYPISCPDGYSFTCIMGAPDCCMGSDCTGELDPACFYTKYCGNYVNPNSMACCSLCPSGTSIMCDYPLQYWCINGRKDCCQQTSEGLLCTPEDEEKEQCSSVIQKNKCNAYSPDSCCKTCPDGTDPVCPSGKSPWCVGNGLRCCDQSGNNCEEAFCRDTFRCPSGGILPESGCCKSCANRIDNPSCSNGTSYWCVNGEEKCCREGYFGSPLCLPNEKPSCPIGGTRQCF